MLKREREVKATSAVNLFPNRVKVVKVVIETIFLKIRKNKKYYKIKNIKKKPKRGTENQMKFEKAFI